ncbi:MAG: nitrite reductase (NADH) large subunit [Oleiphilaceae bacterium]|jgi:nitrite reductase (NADH) large subunit
MQRLVVIGNGMAGMKAVEELISAAPDKYSITVFGAEPYGNYNRIMLSPVLCGEKSIEDIMINDRQWYTDNNIALHAGHEKEIVEINRARKIVIAKDGTQVPYDRLLISTGSNPFILAIPGHELEGVIAFRDVYDVNKMLSYSEHKNYAVVLGGGLLGLEAANGLVQRGMHVTVIHSNKVLLNRQLDNTAGHLLKLELEKRGVHFKLPAKTQTLVDNGAGHVKSVTFEDGSELPCDLFVMAIGVRPNIALAKRAGIHCDKGIVVSDTLQTYDPAIYAVGECIQHRNDTFGLVAPLFEQAKVCANHLSGHGMAEFKTLPSATKLKVTGINLFSLGNFNGDESCDIIRFSDPSAGIYKKLVIKNQQIIGVVLYGATADGAWYQSLLEQRINIEVMREYLIFGQAYFQSDLESQQTLITQNDQADLVGEQ